MVTDYQKMRMKIEDVLNEGKKNFILYPFGEYGKMAKMILNESFGIAERYIVDNHLSKYNPNIKNLDYCRSLNTREYTVLFTCANPEVYEEVYNELEKVFLKKDIVDVTGKKEKYTKCGKYSYGPLCNHWLVESVGAFCSFAVGTDVVENHAIKYISTHPFLYCGGYTDTIRIRKWKEHKGAPYYFSGIDPKGDSHKLKKIQIGNDVWLGKNVLITNSANIGNGVIAGAGAVITKDVPDYAVVAGVPARIIKYRYSKEQIKALNRIAWWDWTDEKIRENYDYFYVDVNEFIHKFL